MGWYTSVVMPLQVFRHPRENLDATTVQAFVLSALSMMRHNVMLAFAAVAQASTFKSCEVPQFEWAAYGNRVTGRMYGMAAAVNDQHIFAAGYLKSTLDPEAAGFIEAMDDYAVTGPYTAADWEGNGATTVTVDLKSYPTPGGAAENAGGSWRAYEAGVVKIDKTTGVPVRHPGAMIPWHHPPTTPTTPTTTHHTHHRRRCARRTCTCTTARAWTRPPGWRRSATYVLP